MNDKKLGDMVFNTPDGIELYRLASIKARIKLEAGGLKVSRGKSTRSQIAGELALSPRDPHERFLTALQARIDVLKEKIARDRMVVEEIGPDFKVTSLDRTAYLMIMEDNNRWKVTYYQAEMVGQVKPVEIVDDQATAMDRAEAWVTEAR